MKTCIQIQSSDELRYFLNSIKSEDCVGIDTEFLRERTYKPLLCLVQMLSHHQIVCIDPLQIDDLSELAKLLSNPRIIKVIHSCRQDLEALATRCEVRIENIFDTQLAADFCGLGDQISYASLVEKICHQHLSKSHTRTNWSKRPLSTAQLEYAADDVRYLNDLHQHLNHMVNQMGRADWLAKEIEIICNQQYFIASEEGCWYQLKGAGSLPAMNRAIAHALTNWRENKARQRDLPREWVLSNRNLLEISKFKPTSLSQLRQLDGLQPAIIQKIGKNIITIIKQTTSQSFHDDETKDPGISHQLTSGQKLTVRVLMKQLAQIAATKQINQALIANRKSIERLVLGDRNLPLMQGWRLKLAGALLLTMLDDEAKQ